MKLVSIFTLLFIALAGLSQACQVPVFRFALERWEADKFHLRVLHREPLPAELSKRLLALNDELSKVPAPANLEIEMLDVGKLSEAERFSIPGMEKISDYPAFLLQAPATWKTSEPAWSEPATVEALDLLLDSPTRQRCAEHLIAGVSVVWLLIESGDETADAQALTKLEEGLEKASSSISIPEGIMRPDEVSQIECEVDLEDVLRSPIPLKIDFQVVRVRRHDPKESVFLNMLAGPQGFPESEEPIVVPIFGRGRTPGPVPASILDADGIMAASEYFCGACSCQVKSGNPGYDLLFKTRWL